MQLWNGANNIGQLFFQTDSFFFCICEFCLRARLYASSLSIKFFVTNSIYWNEGNVWKR